jgi:hypothetical protein
MEQCNKLTPKINPYAGGFLGIIVQWKWTNHQVWTVSIPRWASPLSAASAIHENNWSNGTSVKPYLELISRTIAIVILIFILLKD